MQGFVHTIRDITAEVKIEEEKKQLEEDLRQSLKLEAVGRLAGGIAHDFNNMLSVILNYTGFVLDDLREGDPMRDDLSEVVAAGRRASELTKQLLAFSRKQVMQLTPLDVNTIVTGIEKMLGRLIGEHIDLVSVLAPDIGLVNADVGQIEQVLVNLAVNARDAMPNGGKLTIETAYVDLDEQYAARHVGVLPGGYVVIAVSDTGSGMKKEEKARIFEPFFTTKKQGKGIGLGLATVYGIIKQSGGNVLVYSEPGKGTTFKVYLPRLEVSAEALLPGALEVSSGSTGSETILIVEDEAAVRKAAVRILEAAGYKVLSSNNGGEALLTCEQYDGSIHLLLTDVIMPQMNGRQLAERLVAIRPGLQVLFMSGYTDTAIARHGVLDAGIHFINKPINANDLRRKVREVLDTPIAGEK